MRASALPRNRLESTRTEFPAGGPAESESAISLLRRLGRDRELRDAVALASPSLDQLLTEVEDGRPVEPKRLRKALLALSRYLLRMASRPTPFGLFSGVAALRISDGATARLGSAHRVTARPDMGWLTAVLAALELRPDTLAGLRVTANHLAFRRGDRLVLPYVPERHGAAQRAGGTVVEVSVRFTPAVRAALETVEEPVRYAELERRLAARFPGVPAGRVTDLLRQLVETEFLLTDLRPPATADDPLAHVLDRLPSGPEHTELAAIRQDLSRSEPTADRSPVLRRMRRLHDGDRLLQLDLALDADVTLPTAVAREAERAAEVLWRTSRVRDVGHLAQYHADFVEKYGTDRLVPLIELLDPDRGLGAPAGYLMPPSEREKPAPAAPTPQDAVRIELAQAALLDGRREVVLDEELVARLTPDTTLAPPRSLDLYARVLADSTRELDAGRFRLWLTPEAAADHAGATIGRFSHLLPEAAERIAAACRTAEGQGGADTAQLVLRAAHSRSANLNQVRPLHDRRIVVGAFADPTDPGTVPLADLAVGADLTSLHLARLSTGRRIVPLAWNMLNPQAQVGNTGRFLRELRLSGIRPGFTWDWGPMEQAPYTPRVRYGRTVLAPARWRPTAPFLTDTAMAPDQWRRELDAWRERWGVPDQVLLCVADRALEIDLTAGLHVRLLRQDLARHPDAVLREAPTGEDSYGWLSGPEGAHTAEVVLPLLTTAPADRPRAVPTPARAPRSQPPGGEWLYAKLYASSRRQNDLLAHQLPHLIGELPAGVDRWHFVRYRDPQPHLRLRFHGEPSALNGDLLPKLHDWFTGLHHAGLANRLALDTYEPEWERYGGRDAATAAEEAFHADSTAVLAQLAALETGRLTLDPAVLGALNLIDLLRHLHGEQDFEQRLLATYPRATAPREARATAIRLTDPATLRATPGGPELLAAWQHRAEVLRRHAHLLAPSAPSLVHMHHNRLLGIDPDTEAQAHAIARTTIEALHHRRHTKTGPLLGR